jgi:WD40 repeat protein
MKMLGDGSMTCPRCSGELADGVGDRVCSPCSVILPPSSVVARELLCRAAELPEQFRLLETSVRDLAGSEHWDELEALLLTPSFLEAKVQAGMHFELAEDFALALERLPNGRPWWRVLSLLEEAFLRDLHFIARHPGMLFQCLWNTCWWYDCPEAASRFDPPERGWPAEGAPWDRSGPKLSPLLECWRQAREAANPGPVWLRSLRPPGVPLGGPQRVVIPVNMDGFRFLDLRFSLDGRRVFAWLNPVGTAELSGRQLQAWNAATGQEAGFDRCEVPPYDPRVSTDGRWRVECGGEGGGWGRPLRLLDCATGQQVASFPPDDDVNIREVHFSPGGERIIGGGWGEEGGGEVMVWNVATGARLAWLRPFGSVFAVAVSFNRQLAATGSSGGEVLLWNLDTGEHTATLEGHERSIQALAFSPDGERVVSSSDDGTVRVWDLSRITPLPRLRDHPHGAGGIEFSGDADRMVTSSGDETAWLWDAQSGAPVACFNDQAAHYLEGGPPIPALAIRGDRVLSLLRGEIWTAATGVSIRSPDDRIWTLRLGGRRTVWSPEGSLVASYGYHQEATISSTANLYAEQLRLQGHGETITGAAFSPDSRVLATGSFDRTVRVWNPANGTEVMCLRGHEQAVSCVAFSPDGRFIASGAADRTVRIWDLTAGKESVRIDIDDPGCWCSRWSKECGREDLHAIRAAAFTLGGWRLVTDCGDDFRLWDLRTGTLMRTFAGRGSLGALAAALPWQAFIRGSELVIERHNSGIDVARVPVTPRSDPIAHPGGRIWAVGGRWLRHLALCGSVDGPEMTRR